MALAGPPLAFQPNDQDDVDFFDQLANDLGNGDRLHQNYEQGEGSFDEVFSKLTISGAGPVVAASEIAQENDSGDAANDEFWLQETGLSNGVAPETVTAVTANPSPVISSAAENLPETDAVSPLGTLSLPPSGTHYGDPQDDVSHQSSVLNLAHGKVGLAADRDVPDGAFQNVNAGVTTNPSVGSKSLQSDLASHSHHEVTRSQPLIPNIKELQWSNFSEVFTPEEGPDAFSDLFSELDAGTGAISNLSFGLQPGYRFGLSTVAPFASTSSQSEWGVETGSHADESSPANPASSSDHIAGVQLQSVYGSINEQRMHHSQVESTSPAGFGYFGTGEQHSCDYGMVNEQGGKGQVNVSDARFCDCSEGVQSQGAYGLLSKQGVQNQLEQSKVVPAESASQDIFTGGGGQLHGGSSMSNGYYEAQQQVVQPESLENMYPGWYFDFGSNEWKQIEGWDFSTGSIAVEDWVGGSTDGLLTHFPSSAADALSSHLVEKNQTAVTDLTLQTGSGQVSLSAPGYGSEVLEQLTRAGLTWQTKQEGFPLSASGAIKGLEGHDMDVHEQRTSNGDSGPQQQIYWEEQYPGWYFDYQSQQWQQIAVNSSQSWVPGQHNNVEAIQVAEDSSHSISSLSTPQGVCMEQQSQPEHQHEINKNIHLPERSESLYKSDGDKASLGQGMSFHAWEASAVATNSNDLVGSNTDKVQEASQFWKDGSGYEFQGYTNGDPHLYNQGETDYTPMTQEIPYGNQSSFNVHHSQQYYQSHNAPGTVTEGLQSSAGRPSHALVAFGFGGKLITMKATSGGIPEAVILRDLNQLVLAANSSDRNDGVSYFSALNHGGLAGPLIGGVVTTKELLRWVDDRIANCEMEDPYCTSSEALRILWSVLKVACLHYGKLRSMTGSSSLKLQSEDGPEVALGRLFCAAKSQSHWNQGISASPDALQSVPSEYQLQAIALEMKRSLIDGKRNEALQLAQQGQLWGPALVLAWQLGEKAYVETVMKMAQQQFVLGSPLRTLFLLFAGQTTELFTTQGLPSPAGAAGPYLPGSYNSVKDSAGGMLRDWLGNLSIIAANPTKGDEQVITHLGDCLWKDHGEVAGAHTCYLVADANFESFSESARLCLVGADHFKYQRTFATPTAIQRTELYEYAKFLGNPQFILIPFQPYKLLYAYMLVEAGKISEARRYCQAVTKTLKNAGRGPEIEFCRQSALALEERLRLHSQGGYSLNSATGKLVGKFIGTIDSTIHRIIGGRPQRQASEPSLNKNPRDWYSIGQRMGNSATLTKETSFAPSVSNNNLPNANNQQVEAPPRSVSEPNLNWSPPKEKQNSATGSELASASPKQSKSESLAGGHLGRFGSQFLSKAVGFMKPNKKEAKLGDENKFYYNKELKRWVEEGVEQTMEEVAPPPPPTAASFSSHYGTASLDVKFSTGTEGHGIVAAGNFSSSAGMLSMPPSLNQFSARGRLHGVRSRYVDTFNKGGTLPAKSTESSIVPSAGWGMIPPSTQFFMPATVATPTIDFTQDFDNGQYNNANSHLLLSASSTTKNGQVHAEDEALLPKNLSSSFNAVPSMHKHSSTSNVTAYENNNVTLTEGMGGFMPENGHSISGNTARDVSWSGNSPSAYTSKSVTNLSARPATQRPVLPNGSKVEPENILAGMKADEYMHPTARVFNASLPSPPAIEPPMSYIGAESSLSEKREGHIQSEMLNSVQGVIYSDLQEVEL